MKSLIRSVRDRRAATVLFALVIANLATWLGVLSVSRYFAMILSAGALAYGFGLRHAVDADHISAIDNVTRRLMAMGKRPTGVGFFFSLGHSTIVILLCAGVAASTAYVQSHMPQWQSTGSKLGTAISIVFLVVIGLLNLGVLRGLLRQSEAEASTGGVGPTGLFAAILAPAVRFVGASWQMYFVGLLFGLGFDTATEVGILALSAKSGQSGVPLWAIMLLPLLFTVGMCLIDTLNSLMMLNAYGWASVRPSRKRVYNIAITGASVLVAFFVATSELLQVLADGFGWKNVSHGLGVAFDWTGVIIVCGFGAVWLWTLFRQRTATAVS